MNFMKWRHYILTSLSTNIYHMSGHCWKGSKVKDLTRPVNSCCYRLIRLAVTLIRPITVRPLILATLNFCVWVNLIILDPVILAFLLPTTLKRYLFKFSRPVIFANLPGSWNSRNKGHAKKTGFTVACNDGGIHFNCDGHCVHWITP